MRHIPGAYWVVAVLLVLGALVSGGCGSSDGSPDIPTDGDSDIVDNDTAPVCSGSCMDILPATCQSGKLCTCQNGQWTLVDCVLDCLSNGGSKPGCGPDTTGNNVCVCEGVDGDAEEETVEAEAESEAEPEIELPACSSLSYSVAVKRADIVGSVKASAYYQLMTYNAEDFPYSSLKIVIKAQNEIPLNKDIPISEKEASMYTCKFCVQYHKNCKRNEDTGAVDCEKLFMPYGRGSYRVDTLGDDPGEKLEVSFKNLYLREVTLDGLGHAKPVENGEALCMNDQSFNEILFRPGFVPMEQPTGGTCEYPAPPYYVNGPQPGKATPEPGTMPPMAWPGAYLGDDTNGKQVGLDLYKFKCEHPEIKSIFVMLGAGWCKYCKAFFKEQVCPVDENGVQLATAYEKTLLAKNATIFYVIGENAAGNKATNTYANVLMNSYYCSRGYRLADIDNTAGFRALWANPMYAGIPWVGVIRTKDMKFVYSQSSTEYLDYEGIADELNKDEATPPPTSKLQCLKP